MESLWRIDIKEALLVKSLKKFSTVTACLNHNNISKIIRSINFPQVKGTSEKLRRIFKSHKIKSTFYTENTLRKLFINQKSDWLSGNWR